MLLGGRTAEELTFGDPTTGASDDIDRATQIAMAMVTEYGMSEALGPRRLGHKSGEVFLGKEMGHEPNYSDQVASDIDDEVRRLLDDAHDEAAEILTLHRATLDRMAEELIEHETLDEERLKALFADLDTWEGPTATRSVAPSSIAGPERVPATNIEGGHDKSRRWWRP
jgi:cell division protease FtsH